jgi:hypothetical protein
MRRRAGRFLTIVATVAAILAFLVSGSVNSSDGNYLLGGFIAVVCFLFLGRVITVLNWDR